MSAAKPAIAFSGFGQPFHSVIARMAGEVSPLAPGQAFTDWAEHLWMSPDKQVDLARDAAANEHRPIQPNCRDCTIPVLVWSVGNRPARQEDYERARRQRGVSGH